MRRPDPSGRRPVISRPHLHTSLAVEWPSPLELAADVRAHRSRVLERSPKDRAALAELLWYDTSTEYDARHLTHLLESRRVDFSPAFWAAHGRWAAEEERHHAGFLAVLEALFGESAGGSESLTWRARLATRRPEPRALAAALEDELDVLLAGAYDELVTVRAYRANLETYDSLGQVMARFVRLVIADEAGHYASFLELLQRQHRSQLDQAPERLARLRRMMDPEPYGGVFLFDHQGPEYTRALTDRAEAILLRQLGG